MGRHTLPTAFDIRSRAQNVAPKGTDQFVEYFNRLLHQVYSNSEMCESGKASIHLKTLVDMHCDRDIIINYLTDLGYRVELNPEIPSIIISW